MEAGLAAEAAVAGLEVGEGLVKAAARAAAADGVAKE